MTVFGQRAKGFSGRPKILEYLGAGGMPEDDARELAAELVRHARSEGSRFVEGAAPDPGEVRERPEAHHPNGA